MRRALQMMLTLFATVSVLTAQTVGVTLTVDVSNETVDPTGVHVAGSFQDPAWQPGDTPMNDNGDGTWSITLDLDANTTYEYKFLLGNDWSLGNEGLDPATALCTVGGPDNNGNRILTTGMEDMEVAFCYNSCGPCAGADEFSVGFAVDMSQASELSDRIIVSGSFPNANYDETYVMTDYRGDSTYSIVFPLPAGDYEYKFRNGPDGWEDVAADCAQPSGNRGVTVDGDLNLDVVCFTQCEACNFEVKDTVAVTVLVDMSFIAGTDGVAPDGVFMAGSYQSAAGLGSNWNPVDAPMSDMDGDNIYEITFDIPEGDYQFKFLNGEGGWEGVPNECAVGGNRAFTADSENGDSMVVGPFCFNSCSEDCPEVLEPVNVTFRVDMSNEFVAAEGLFVAGDFNSGATWVKDTFQLMEGSTAGIYEFTTMIRPGFEYQYKFANGGTTETEENHDFVTDGCGVNSGASVNRQLNLVSTQTDTILPAYIYNSCELSPLVSNEEITYLTDMTVFPNPAVDVLIIDMPETSGLAHRVQLFDVAGQLMYSAPATRDNRITIERGNLAEGLYIGQIINEQEAIKSFRVFFK